MTRAWPRARAHTHTQGQTDLQTWHPHCMFNSSTMCVKIRNGLLVNVANVCVSSLSPHKTWLVPIKSNKIFVPFLPQMVTFLGLQLQLLVFWSSQNLAFHQLFVISLAPPSICQKSIWKHAKNNLKFNMSHKHAKQEVSWGTKRLQLWHY